MGVVSKVSHMLFTRVGDYSRLDMPLQCDIECVNLDVLVLSCQLFGVWPAL